MNFENICVTCEAKGTHLSSIFESDIFEGQEISYLKIISMIINNEVTDLFKVPHKICSDCQNELKRYFLFRKKTRASFRKMNLLTIDPLSEENKAGTDLTKCLEFQNIHGDLDESINADNVKSIEGVLTFSAEDEEMNTNDKSFSTNESNSYDSHDELSNESWEYDEGKVKQSTYRCHRCSSEFDTRVRLRAHLVAEHMRPKIHECTICNKKFTTMPQLRRHEKSHGTSPVNCEICQKQFKTKGILEKHAQMHNKPRPLCPHCGKTFSRVDHLNIHLRRHTGETPYKCYTCQKAYPSHSQLTDHHALHHQKSGLVCGVCLKKFIRPSSLQTHMRIHTGEKPFQCELCSKSFTSSTALRKHITNKYCNEAAHSVSKNDAKII